MRFSLPVALLVASTLASSVAAAKTPKSKPVAVVKKPARVITLDHARMVTMFPADYPGSIIVPHPAVPPITIVVTPRAHGDARPYPHGILLVDPPRRHSFYSRSCCDQVSFVAITFARRPTPQVPYWPWIAAGVLGTLAVVIVARERRAALAQPI